MSLHAALQLLDLSGERGDQEVLFAAEVAIERAQRNPSCSRHVPEADGLESAFLGQIYCGVYDAARSLIHAIIGTCFTTGGEPTDWYVAATPARGGA